jgi:hypothetical protein
MFSGNTRAVVAITVTIAMLLLAGCPTRTTIADLNRDPGRYAGKDVSIGGRVSDSFGALGNGIFEVDDGTGRMWVYSQNYGVPNNGSNVSLTGRVEQGFSFGGRSFGVILRETSKRH